jgi:hypothetical protein
MDQTDPPFYTFLSQTNIEMSDVSSVQSTSSQASDDSDRVPTQEDLDNDNWRYLSDFFVMTKTPTNTSTRLCGYKCMLCLPSDRIVTASKTTYDARKAISRLITRTKKVNSKLSLVRDLATTAEKRFCWNSFLTNQQAEDYCRLLWTTVGEARAAGQQWWAK